MPADTQLPPLSIPSPPRLSGCYFCSPPASLAEVNVDTLGELESAEMLAGVLVLGTILTALPGHTMKRVMWFRVSAEGRREFAHHTDPNQISLSYRGRTRYIGGSYSSCSVQIRGVKLSDAGQYHFRFETDQPLGRWTSPDTVSLEVTDLQVKVHPARPSNMFGFGETVYVGCQARGCAAPGRSLALYRSGLNLGSYEKWKTINRFDKQHSGAYTCRPIPPQNVQSPSLSLTLGHSPHSTAMAVFPLGEVSEGGSVTLTCSSDAAPPVESFAWFKDMESGSIPDSFSPQLHLSYLKYTDKGEYYCVARNSLGTDRSTSVLLNVTYSPKNTRVWMSPHRDIREGSHVNLNCVSHSNPPPSRYAWYRILGDQVVTKGNFQNLTFPSVRAHHADPPKNTSVQARPSSVVDAGRPLTLTCSSQANPAVDNFTWHRLALDGGSVQSWSTKLGAVFTFSEVSPGESGQYYCEARNRIGAHSSPVLTVRVRGRLKVIALASAVGVSAGLITLTVAIMISKNMHRVDTETIEGANKRLSVSTDTMFYESAEHTFPPRKGKMSDIPEEPEDLSDSSHPSIVPLKDAPPVTESGSRSHASSYITVHYSKLSSADQVQVHNLSLGDAPKEVTLTVNPSGDIIKGGVVHFTCSCDANPPVTQSGYSLYRDGEFIGSGQKHVIADIQPSHSGRYRCLAWNNISWRGRFFISSTAITLDVQYGPMNISVSMEPPTVVEGAGVNLTCSSAANPAADNYTWYKMTASQTSQKMVQVGSGQVLSLASVEASHTGFYICKVRNSLGENNSTEAFNSHEEEVTYSTVTIKERNPSPPSHMNRSRSAKVNKDDSSVIYASVNKSS
ncbi:unnamed protein product [Menidia menidia]|uniref:(Atlantic silverside) hypothetical protein n=1 Tax=Menidia menidia TaxID=238744 RepID=A0A8S4BPE6_9TELE|nr:unnamed protein product [Menidia menidia]